MPRYWSLPDALPSADLDGAWIEAYRAECEQLEDDLRTAVALQHDRYLDRLHVAYSGTILDPRPHAIPPAVASWVRWAD